MNPERIIAKARKSIGLFCKEECCAYCCRKGYLVLKKSQIDLVTNGKKKELEEKDLIMKKSQGAFSLFMGNKDYPCPSLLNDFSCSIHSKKNRPQACKDFPLFVKGKSLMLSPRCLAVRQGKLYPYIKKLLALGYKIEPPEMFSELEIYSFQF